MVSYISRESSSCSAFESALQRCIGYIKLILVATATLARTPSASRLKPYRLEGSGSTEIDRSNEGTMLRALEEMTLWDFLNPGQVVKHAEW